MPARGLAPRYSRESPRVARRSATTYRLRLSSTKIAFASSASAIASAAFATGSRPSSGGSAVCSVSIFASSDRGGYPIAIRMVNRSSCASGSGYVPSYSIGFCVAMTMNGRARWYVTPSIVTWRSCMHSSSADCVLGDARLISSTSSTFAKTGPGRNSNSFDAWLKTFTPVTSDGKRSGVNCMREKSTSTERESALASVVFPTPGRSSMIRCPSATRERTTNRSVSSGACTTRRRFSTISAIARAESATVTRSVPIASSKELHHLVEDLLGDLTLRGPRDRALAAVGHQGHLVRVAVEADVRPRYVVEDDQVRALVGQLAASAVQRLARFGREADEHAVRLARAEGAQHVRRGVELDRPGGAILGALAGDALRRAVVGDRGGHEHDVCVCAREHLALDVRRGGRVDELDTARDRNRDVRHDERHVGATPSRLVRERDAHAPRRAVADVTHLVDRLTRPARGHEHALPSQLVANREQPHARFENLLGLRHAAYAELALRRVTLVRVDDLDAARTQCRHVGARCGVRPHPRVHRGRNDERSTVGERGLGDEVVRLAVRELRERVRRQRRDHVEIGARQVGVEVVVRLASRERVERPAPHEAVRAVRDERNDLMARLDEEAYEFTGLVGRDPASDTDQNPRHGHIVPTKRLERLKNS